MHFPQGDYVSPGFATVKPDQAFPHLISGTPETCPWGYAQPQVTHNWYGDERWQRVGFLSRDEAMILHNTALQFSGQQSLEVGCWLGWGTCHLALAGVEVDAIDPMLARPEVRQSINESLKLAGIAERVHLVAGSSPQAIQSLAVAKQRTWSLIVVDGNSMAPAPLQDAIACEQVAAADALILFNNLISPDVAQGLDYLRQRGWNTLIYQTMHLMGVAWRGQVEPVHHQPDPSIDWQLPSHLTYYSVSTGDARSGEPQPGDAPDGSPNLPSDWPAHVEDMGERADPSGGAWAIAQHYTYRGVPCPVHPLDFTLYPLVVWDLKPRTVLLFGDQSGGMALWFGDLLLNFAIDSQVYAFADIQVTGLAHPRISWNASSATHLDQALSSTLLAQLPHPWLVLEQYEQEGATPNVLEFFHPHLHPGDLVIVAGTPDPTLQTARYQAIQTWLARQPGAYQRDRRYCDFFGTNQSSLPGGFLRKVQMTPPPPTPAPITSPQTSLLEQLLAHIHRAKVPTPTAINANLDPQQLRQQFQTGQKAYQNGDYAGAIAALNSVILYCPDSVRTHQFLSAAHWHQGNLQASIDHYLVAQVAHSLAEGVVGKWVSEQVSKNAPAQPTSPIELIHQIQPHSRLQETQLRSLYQLATQICRDDIPGDFVQIGEDIGAAALLATVIKRHSRVRRSLYLFTTTAAVEFSSEELIQSEGSEAGEFQYHDPLDALCHDLHARGIVVRQLGQFKPISNSVENPTSQNESSVTTPVALAHLVEPNSSAALKELYFAMTPAGIWQIADYARESTEELTEESAQDAGDRIPGTQWPSLIAALEHHCHTSFLLRWVDETAVWWRIQSALEPDADYALNLWRMAQTASRLGRSEESLQALRGALTLMPRLVAAEALLSPASPIPAPPSSPVSPAAAGVRSESPPATGSPEASPNPETSESEVSGSEASKPLGNEFDESTLPSDADGVADYSADYSSDACDLETDPDSEVAELLKALGIRDLVELDEMIRQFQEEPDAMLVAGQLRRIRQHLAEQCLSMPGDELDWLYPDDLGEIHRMIMASGLRDEPLTQAEQDFRKDNLEFLQDGVAVPGGIQHLLAVMLFIYPHELPTILDVQAIPIWLLTDYLWFMGTPPNAGQEKPVKSFGNHLAQWTQYMAEQVQAHNQEGDPAQEFWQQVAIAFTDLTDFSPIETELDQWPGLATQREAIAQVASDT
jgi:cephalosporin hydroxylase/tetratricopeptide (TPR) repeat protein